jgi:hypothetical protein
LTMGFRPQLVIVSGLSVGIPLMVGFRTQLVVVSGLSVGIPLTVGFNLSCSLQLSSSPFHELFFDTMEFRLSRSLSRTFPSHDGISAITELVTNFSFTRWYFGYHEPFTNFSFTRWYFGYHGAFSWWNFAKHRIWGKTLFIYISQRVFT